MELNMHACMHACTCSLSLSLVCRRRGEERGGEGRRGRPPIAISNVIIMIVMVPTTHLLLTETSI
jgi:hypothetical protein